MLDWQVYDCDDWINESSSEEVEGDEATFEGENPQDAAPAQLPNEWTWDMPFKDRMGWRFKTRKPSTVSLADSEVVICTTW